MVTVRRRLTRHGHRDGRPTLEQRFRFEGATLERLEAALWSVPMLGPDSVFGKRPGARSHDEDGRRTVHDFSPVPGFRFDVELQHRDAHLCVVRFAQPDRTVPFLAGELVWLLSGDDSGAWLDEEINTPRAQEHGAEPLTGPRPSLRRWLFFRVGHAKVMDLAMGNLGRLL